MPALQTAKVINQENADYICFIAAVAALTEPNLSLLRDPAAPLCRKLNGVYSSDEFHLPVRFGALGQIRTPKS